MDMQDICRICLSQSDSMTSIFQEEYLKIPMAIRISGCLALEVSRVDGLPQQICKTCVSQLDVFYKFKELSAAAEKVLKKIIYEKDEDLVEFLKTRDEMRELKLTFEPSPQVSDERNVAKTQSFDKVAKKTKAVRCNDCPLSFKTRSEWLVHNFSRHRPRLKIKRNSSNMWIEDKAGVMRLTSNLKANQSDKSRLSVHLKAAKDEPKTVDTSITKICKLCEVFVGTREEVKAHQDNCGRAGPFKCADCDEMFLSKAGLTRHKTQMGEHKQKLTCNHCLKEFLTRKKLLEHLKRISRMIKCNSCEKMFPSNQSLKLHLAVRHGAKADKFFECELCGYKNCCKATMQKHILVHSEPSIICSYCGRGFRFKYNYSRHYESHHAKDEEKVVCDVCGGLFTKFKLKHHLLTHGPPTHECEFCNKKFTKRAQLRKHRICMHQTAPFPCKYCKNGFTKSQTLSDHIKRVHPGKKKGNDGRREKEARK